MDPVLAGLMTSLGGFLYGLGTGISEVSKFSEEDKLVDRECDPSKIAEAQHLKVLVKEFDIKYEKITVHGGGAKSVIWSSIVCDVLGVKTTRAIEADSSYRRALIGLNGLGVYSDLKQAQCCAVFNQNIFSEYGQL